MPYTEVMATVYYGRAMMLNPYVVINERVRRRASMVAPGWTKTRERGQA